MILLACVESFAFVFATFVLLTWHSPLDLRVALAGIYILIGTAAHVAVAVLRRLDTLIDWNVRGGGK